MTGKGSYPADAACILCRHTGDPKAVERLADFLQSLAQSQPEILTQAGVDPATYPHVFRAAVERIRGVQSASPADKTRFLTAMLARLVTSGNAVSWERIGSRGRQDFRLTLKGGYAVCIEAKGCPDGNNMNIWERPNWADEFVVWSQCPESTAHQPGEGVWSGIATRLIPHSIATGQLVDAFVFHDGRCGSNIRPCPKPYGLNGDFRGMATIIPPEDGKNRVPVPCIYLFPRTVPHPQTNKHPALHNLDTCRFARAVLTTFGVPLGEQINQVYWVDVQLDPRTNGVYRKVAIGFGLDNGQPLFQGGWVRIRRE